LMKRFAWCWHNVCQLKHGPDLLVPVDVSEGANKPLQHIMSDDGCATNSDRQCPATGLFVTPTFLSESYGIIKCTNCSDYIYGQAYKVIFIADTWLHVSSYNQNTFAATRSKFRGHRGSPVTNLSRTVGTLIDAHYPVTIFKCMFIFDFEPVNTRVWTKTATLTLSVYLQKI
jgi:hypothetical protein